MRSFEGQHSDAVPIRRTTEQKAVLLRQLKGELKSLKPTVAGTIREALQRRITDLERDLDSNAAPGRAGHGAFRGV